MRSLILKLHTLCIETDASPFGMGACMSQNVSRNGEAWKNVQQCCVCYIFFLIQALLSKR